MLKKLTRNVHQNIQNPTENGTSYYIRGYYYYFHYCCDKFEDRGWGCGYRTLQTLCSWLIVTLNLENANVPSIPDIQRTLVEIEDKPATFQQSREWIGSVEVCLILDQLFNVPSKIIHINKGYNLKQYINTIKEHFEEFGSPIMMGGDQDCSSKGIMGIHIADDQTYLLIVVGQDPHFVGTVKSPEQLQHEGWVKWQLLSDFIDSSMYNLCLPQIKYNK